MLFISNALSIASADLAGELAPLFQARAAEWSEFVQWQQKAPLSDQTTSSSSCTNNPAVPPVPAAAPVPDQLYRRLADAVPEESVSVPLLLNCLVEQVDFNADLEADLQAQEEHRAALADAQRLASVASADADAQPDAQPATPAAAATTPAPVPAPAPVNLLASLASAQMEEHVVRHWRLLAQLGDSDASQQPPPQQSAPSQSSLVVAEGDAAGLRRLCSTLTASPLPPAPPALLEWMREGEAHMLSLLPLPGLPLPVRIYSVCVLCCC